MPGFDIPTPRFNLDGSPVMEERAANTLGRNAFDVADNTTVNSLTVELQRSLDYYKREFPDVPPVNSIVIATTQPELASLAGWLTEKLQVETTMVTLPTVGTADPAVRSRLEEPAGVRFTRAGGLAMQELDKLPEGVPEFNLQGRRKAQRAPSAVSGRMAFSLAFSFLVLLIGSINMFRVSQDANRLDHALDRAQAERQSLSTYRGLPLDEVRRQKEIVNVLLPVGEPLPYVVDAMAGAVPPDAAIMEISREKPGILSVSGETSNDAVLVQFLDALRQLPTCAKVSLDTLSRNSSASNDGTKRENTLHYQITAQIRPMP
jgi:hypothetical protein